MPRRDSGPSIRRTLNATAAAFLILFLISGAGAAPIRLQSGNIVPPSKRFAKADSSVPARGSLHIIQFQGPIQEAWKQALRGMGIHLYDYLPDYSFVARMNADQVKLALTLDYVRWVQRLAPQYRMGRKLAKSAGGHSDVIIRLSPDQSLTDVEKLVRSLGGKLFAGRGSADRSLRALVPTSALSSLAAFDGIAWVEEWVQPRVTNNVAQGIVGAPEVRQRVGLYGSGQTVAFADSGLDSGSTSTLSADFAGRVISAYPIRRQNDWSDLTGHGTHVMGIAAGSGVLSGSNPSAHSYTGSFAGVAPEASLIIQSIGDSTPYVYPPLNLSSLLQPAYDDGARVHSDSWGTPSLGEYTVYSQQVDDFLWHHPDLVAVFPAGNDGRDGNANGVTDPGQMYAPATAKNCIAVGATESVRNAGLVVKYGQQWPSDFPADPLFSDYISDNASGMVGWSGRGPCKDGRIKPDICAPGTNIISARSHAVAVVGWGVYDSNYIYWGGTSMATPMVAGAAALVREYYVENRSVQPSAALVKATLLNGATDITPGQYKSPYPTEVQPRPNSVEGWGRMSLSGSLAPLAPRLIEFVDETSGMQTGQSRQYTYTILGSSTPLSVTLAWTDYPASTLAAKQLVNDLNLVVVDPSGHMYQGNGSTDSTNNVETVDITAPTPGTYTVTVSAANVPIGPQPFALVISGELPGTYIAGTVRTASGRPVSGVTISATTGATTKTTTTGGNGAYTVYLTSGDYTVTPSKQGWSFNPANTVVNVAASGVNDVDFTGSAALGSMTGTVSKAAGGTTDYVIDTPHPYANRADTIYTITAYPGAARVRVHFDDISVQNGFDFVLVEDAAGAQVDQYTGEWSNQWSRWVTGNVVKIHLYTDDTVTGYGFHVDGYETDLATQGGLGGVTITAQPGGATTVTQPDGTFAFGQLEPVQYTISPAFDHWAFSPSMRSVEVSPGAATTGQDFLAFPPGSISGSVTTGTVTEQAQVVESPHPYEANSYETYTVQGPSDATRMRVHFPQIETEGGFDFIYVTDAGDSIVDEFTGSYTNVWSSWIEGNSLKIVIESDGAGEFYGFATDKLDALVNKHGIPGTTVGLQPGGQSATTGSDGGYTIEGVLGGHYGVTATRPYWTFDPASCELNVVTGLTTTGADFFGTLTAMPGIAYLKSLPDEEDVSVAGKVATAGSGDLSGCYIEEDDRSSGIRVDVPTAVTQGDRINVSGKIRTSGGERYINASSVYISASSVPLPRPLGLKDAAVGGQALNVYTPGVTDRHGLNNIGLLIRVWGNVTFSTPGYCYVDDGGGVLSADGHLGVKVACGTVAPPAAGSLVQVVGLSSCEPSTPGYARVVRIRRDTDIQVFAPPP